MTRLMELIGADHSTRVPYERRELALEYIVQVQNWGSSSLINLAAISQRYYLPVLTLKTGCMATCTHSLQGLVAKVKDRVVHVYMYM